jgi:hypothetical protein
MQQIMPIKGDWYDSTKFYPIECLKVLCCFPGTDLFWIDQVRNMGDRNGIRWVREDVLYDKTDADRNPFSWQLPILPDS